jgi:uncharacterized membrane protein
MTSFFQGKNFKFKRVWVLCMYLVGCQFWQKLTSKQMVFAPVLEK